MAVGPSLCRGKEETKMDIMLDYTDEKFFTPYIYPESWRPDHPLRQLINLFLITNIGGALLYLSCATASFYLLFDHELMKHPLFLKVTQISFILVLLFILITRFHTGSGEARNQIHVMVCPVDQSSDCGALLARSPRLQ